MKHHLFTLKFGLNSASQIFGWTHRVTVIRSIDRTGHLGWLQVWGLTGQKPHWGWLGLSPLMGPLPPSGSGALKIPKGNNRSLMAFWRQVSGSGQLWGVRKDTPLLDGQSREVTLQMGMQIRTEGIYGHSLQSPTWTN